MKNYLLTTFIIFSTGLIFADDHSSSEKEVLSKISEYWDSVGVNCITGIYEPFGYTICVTIDRGIPVVVSNIDGPKEIIEEVKPKNDYAIGHPKFWQDISIDALLEGDKEYSQWQDRDAMWMGR